MNLDEIQTRTNALSDAMGTKGMSGPKASAQVNSHSQPYVMLQWRKRDRPDRSGYSSETEYEWFRSDTLEDAFTDATAFVDAQPSPDERRMSEFMSALGSVIELGRENGIEVGFVNPLVETMKKLSENALTHQSGDA